LKDKVVIITGGSSGIGKACALEFGKKGSKVIIAARNAEKLAEAERELRSFHINCFSVQADVSKEEDCKALIEKTVEKFGGIDVLINNAGISMRALFRDLDLQVLKNLMDVNFWGMVYCTKYALPHLLESKGSVVGVSSIAGHVGLPGRTGYSASKFAIQGFLDALRTENLKTGLHVLVVCPGYTASNIRNTALVADGSAQGETPRDEEKMMKPEEVAEAIYKAVVGRKRKIILTVLGKLAVWITKRFPKLADKLIFNSVSKEPGMDF